MKFGVKPATRVLILKPGDKICRHCELRRVLRPRGLCDSCYKQPAVRALYPSTSPYARRGRGQSGSVGGDRLPDRACEAPAGSAERIIELERRAAAGVNLNHPGDSLYITEVPSCARSVSAGVKNGRVTKVTGRVVGNDVRVWDRERGKMVTKATGRRKKRDR